VQLLPVDACYKVWTASHDDFYWMCQQVRIASSCMPPDLVTAITNGLVR